MEEPFGNDEELKVDIPKKETQKKKFELTFWQKLLIIAVILIVWIIIVIVELTITFRGEKE